MERGKSDPRVDVLTRVGPFRMLRNPAEFIPPFEEAIKEVCTTGALFPTT